MLKTTITVFVFWLAWVSGFLIGWKLEEKQKRARRYSQKLMFLRSIENAGRRIMREDENKRILSEPIRQSKPEPMRKACGLFSSCDAQMLVK